MHIPDGFLSGTLASGTGVAALGAVYLSARRATQQLQQQPQLVPLLATTGAFVFAAQMLNFPIGGGTSGHFLGAAFLAALLGPWSACLVMALVVTIQCLVFADGGLSALGANIFNMGVVATLSGYVSMRVVRKVLRPGRRGFVVAAGIGSWISVMLAATACSLELAVSGTSPLWLVLPAMLGAHAVIGVGEALITVAVLSAILAARPDIVPQWARVDEATIPAGRRLGPVAVGVMLTAVVLAICFSPLASSAPDGLEKVAATHGFASASARPAMWQHSLLADYAVPGIGANGASTSVAGVLGTAAVFAVGFCVVKLFNRASRARRT